MASPSPSPSPSPLPLCVICQLPSSERIRLYPCNHIACTLCVTDTMAACPLCAKEIVTFGREGLSVTSEESKESHEIVWPSVGIIEQLDSSLGSECSLATPTDLIHYECFRDGDGGWGCAYRCLQMILSNLLNTQTSLASPSPSPSPFSLSPPWYSVSAYKAIASTYDSPSSSPHPHPSRWEMIPSIREIQEVLSSLGRMPTEDIGSSRWIEPPDAGEYLRR